MRIVNNFQSTTSVPHASNSRLSPLPLEPAGFSYDRRATIDIPLDTASGGSQNQEVRRKEEAVARAGIIVEEKNWPPFFPIIHHDIASEIPIHLQRLQIGSMPFGEHHSRYYNMDQRGRAMKLYTAQSGSNKRVSINWINCFVSLSVGRYRVWILCL
ncbi:secretory carrier-associated membrane protein 3-like [Hibiscus syriacus]|uniref:secretory carrier-associated membrane protein 3-like n=1 Tax=Hibiscus syriacus TaxID=106335 RepID=UPI00192315F0|nr:secretory carrier-associated membrane protein 3-like [Hibiscus syriacus]